MLAIVGKSIMDGRDLLNAKRAATALLQPASETYKVELKVLTRLCLCLLGDLLKTYHTAVGVLLAFVCGLRFYGGKSRFK